MLIQFTAHLLLDHPWRLDLAATAAALSARFPEIGDVEAVEGATPHAGLLTIDGGLVVLMAPPGPMGEGELWPPFTPLRGWDPRPAVERHQGRITVSCGGDNIPGLEGAKTFAAVTTLVAAALCEIAPVCAVLWAEGWVLMPPEEVMEAAETVLAGRMPINAWIGFTPVVPRGYDPSRARGMVTTGLAPFTGRELELAPAPDSTRVAYERLAMLIRRVLEDGMPLTDRALLRDPASGERVQLRLMAAWWRRNVPACVVLVPDTLAHPVTLHIQKPAVEDRRKLFRRQMRL